MKGKWGRLNLVISCERFLFGVEIEDGRYVEGKKGKGNKARW